MKNVCFFLCCVFVTFVPGSIFAESNPLPIPLPPAQKIKVGVAAELTGDAATYGLDIRDAVTFANEKLGNGRYELIFEDEKCNAKDSVSVAHKFIDIDKVDFVIGFGCSGAALAAAPLFEKAKIPVIVSAASTPKLSGVGDYIFRTHPNDHAVMRLLFDYIEGRHKKLGILSEESQFCQDIRGEFVGFNANQKLEILTENYVASNVDLKTLLLKFRAAGVEALFLNPQTESGLLQAVQEVRRMRWDVKLYSAYFLAARAFLDIAKEQADGMYGVDLPPLSEIVAADSKKLVSEFLAKHGKIRSYDAIFPTAFESFRAMDLASRSGKDPREFLYSAKIDGLLGPYHFDKNGDIVGINPVMKKIENGKAVVIH